MLEISNVEVVGWEHAIRGMRNPKNSWDRMDSVEDNLGANDLNLMTTLSNAGNDHGKYLRMITVYCDINAPLYWWKEYDTYKVGTVANSCSTMHKIHAKEFTLDDFSYEHLFNEDIDFSDDYEYAKLRDEDEEFSNFYYNQDSYLDGLQFLDVFENLIDMLNHARFMFLKTKDKKYWWQMIQLLPSSYNQKRTVMLNYAVLKNMYHSRKFHKLDEWHTFCEWVETLPNSELITQ